jgi:hypothetical protein
LNVEYAVIDSPVMQQAAIFSAESGQSGYRGLKAAALEVYGGSTHRFAREREPFCHCRDFRAISHDEFLFQPGRKPNFRLHGKRAIDREPARGRPQLRSFGLQAVSAGSHRLKEKAPEGVGHGGSDSVSQRVQQTNRGLRHRPAIRSESSPAHRGELKLSPGYLTQAKADQSADTFQDFQDQWLPESWDAHFSAHFNALTAKTRRNREVQVAIRRATQSLSQGTTPGV